MKRATLVFLRVLLGAPAGTPSRLLSPYPLHTHLANLPHVEALAFHNSIVLPCDAFMRLLTLVYACLPPRSRCTSSTASERSHF